MALREEFEQSGGWLFRWRSYLPLVLIGITLFALREYAIPGQSETLEQLWEGVCLLVSFFGLGIRVFTIGHTPRHTSGRNTRKQLASALNTSGIYSVVRHPLYLGNFFMYLGIALFPHLWWLILIYILFFTVYYERIMFAEEAFLREKFGPEFEEWSSRTPSFIPRFSQYVQPNLPFSLKNVLRREYNGFFAVIVVLFFFEVVGDYVVGKGFELDTMWAILLSVGFSVWSVCLVLKRWTKILRVEGR